MLGVYAGGGRHLPQSESGGITGGKFWKILCQTMHFWEYLCDNWSHFALLNTDVEAFLNQLSLLDSYNIVGREIVT